MSMLAAAAPVTVILALVVCSRSVRSALMVCTRVAVCSLLGPPVGMTVTMAAFPALLGMGGATRATPASPLTRLATLAAAWVAAPSGESTRTTSGPLNPGPKVPAWRS
jgi:hypothetical protein